MDAQLRKHHENRIQFCDDLIKGHIDLIKKLEKELVYLRKIRKESYVELASGDKKE